jgi:hypothetical protein
MGIISFIYVKRPQQNSLVGAFLNIGVGGKKELVRDRYLRRSVGLKPSVLEKLAQGRYHDVRLLEALSNRKCFDISIKVMGNDHRDADLFAGAIAALTCLSCDFFAHSCTPL